MKNTLLILFIAGLSMTLSGQTPSWEGKFIATDKALHFTYSAAFTMLAIETAKDWKVKNPEMAGLSAGFAIGLAKEFLYDNNQSSRDLLVDFTGCVAGIYLNRVINRHIDKFYKRKNWTQHGNSSKPRT